MKDSAALTASIALASALGGGVVNVPPGEYWIGSDITMASGVRLIGSGNRTVLKAIPNMRAAAATAVGNVIHCQDISEFSIESLCVDGNRANNSDFNPSDSRQNGIAVVGCTNWAVRNVMSKSNVFHGLFIRNNGATTNVGGDVSGCVLTDNGYRGAHAHGDTNGAVARLRVSNNYCYENGKHLSAWDGSSGADLHGILSGIFVAFDNMDDVVIADNIVYGEPGPGIVVTGAISGGTKSVRGVKVVGNGVSRCGAGILLNTGSTSGGTLRYGNIVGNTVLDCHGIGIGVSTTGGDVVGVNIEGNTILNEATYFYNTATTVAGSAAVTLGSSTTLLSVGDGVVIAGAGAAAAVTGCSATRTGNIVTVTKTSHGLLSGTIIYSTSGFSTGSMNSSVSLASPVTVVDANTFRFFFEGADVVTPATGGTVTPNTSNLYKIAAVTDATHVVLDRVAHTAVSGANVVRSLTAYGLWVGSSSGSYTVKASNIIGNIVSGMGGDSTLGVGTAGVYLQRLSNCNVLGNQSYLNKAVGLTGKSIRQVNVSDCTNSNFCDNYVENDAAASGSIPWEVSGTSTGNTISRNRGVRSGGGNVISINGASCTGNVLADNLCQVTVAAGTSNYVAGNISTGSVAAGNFGRRSNVNGTGAGSAALGANCPAVTPSAPNTWETVVLADGSVGYQPVWK